MSDSDNTVHNALSWVKDELDGLIKEARQHINAYLEESEKDALTKALPLIQQVQGTLSMVEQHGSSMLAEETSELLLAIIEGRVTDKDASFELVLQSLLQLPDYLERVEIGHQDVPLVLLPLMNDMRAARKADLLSEGVLFFPDIAQTAIENIELQSSGEDLQALIKKLRQRYQLGLLSWFRKKDTDAGLQTIQTVLKHLHDASLESSVRSLWWISLAVTEALVDLGVDANSVAIKSLMGRVDRQMKAVLDDGEEDYSKRIPSGLIKNLLYYVATATSTGEAVTSVKQAYMLQDYLPGGNVFESTLASLTGPNRELVKAVSQAVEEDLITIKDGLEVYVHNQKDDPDILNGFAHMLRKMSDTLGMIGLGPVRETAIELAERLEAIGESGASEAAVEMVANDLLNIERGLKEYVSDGGVSQVFLDEVSDQKMPNTAEFRDVLTAVTKETLREMARAKDQILQYIAHPDDRGLLRGTPAQIDQVKGALLMLPIGKLMPILDGIRNYIAINILSKEIRPGNDELEAMADAITSVEFYLEALSANRGDHPHILDVGLASVEKLGVSLEPMSADDNDLVLDAVDESTGNVDDLDVDEAVSIDVPSAPKPTPAVERDPLPVLDGEIDEEILEIFLEEAEEEIQRIKEYLPMWQENLSNNDALTTIRRSFHTLKGSGRLVGAKLLGEFAWSHESMLNRVIDETIDPTEHVFAALYNALDALPELVEQIKTNKEPEQNIMGLMDVVDAISQGEYQGGGVVREIESEADRNAFVEKAEEISVADVSQEEADAFNSIFEGDDEVALSEEDEPDSWDKDDLSYALDNVNLKDSSADLSAENLQTVSIDADALSELREQLDAEAADKNIQDERSVNEGLSEQTASIDADILNELRDQMTDDNNNLSSNSAIQDDALQTLDIDAESLAALRQELSDSPSRDQSEDDNVTLEDFELSLGDDESEEEAIVLEEPDQGSDEDSRIDPVLFDIFKTETEQHVQTLEKLTDGVSKLSVSPELLRALHTLNGSARTAEVPEISSVFAPLEHISREHEIDERPLSENFVAIIRDSVTHVRQVLSALGQPGASVPDGQQLKVRIEHASSAPSASSKDDDPSIDADPASTETALDEILVPETAPQIKQAEKPSFETLTLSVADFQGKPDLPEDQDSELLEIFSEEAREIIDSTDGTLQSWSEDPSNQEAINELQRQMHTLKGGARMAGMMHIGNLSHEFEALVVAIEEGKVPAQRSMFDHLQRVMDALSLMVDQVIGSQPVYPRSDLVDVLTKLRSGVEVDDAVSEQAAPPAHKEVEEPEIIEAAPPPVEEFDEQDHELLEASHDMGTDDAVFSDASELDDVVVAATKAVESQSTTESEQSAQTAKASGEQVRVRSEALENLVNYAGEANIYHARIGQEVLGFGYNLNELGQTVTRLKDQLRKLEMETEAQVRANYEQQMREEGQDVDADFDPLEMDEYSSIQQLSRALAESVNDLTSIEDTMMDQVRDTETLLLQQSRVNTDLQEGLMRTRMVQFAGMMPRLRRIVRQTADELGKKISLSVSGEHSELDRNVLDHMIAPMEHMLRNAIAHGIESPEDRIKAGKPEQGTIEVKVHREGAEVVLDIKDDGAGINVARVREKIREQRLSSNVDLLTDEQVIGFILESGFSTADSVSQIAGRGVGMDVVNSEIKQVGGTLGIYSEASKGTHFTVRLPFTLAINQALLVQMNEDLFAVPLDGIEGIVRIPADELVKSFADKHPVMDYAAGQYELHNLSQMLGMSHHTPYEDSQGLFPVLLISSGERKLALQVDQLLGSREVVVKSVGPQISKVRGIAGATILGDGRVVLILDMPGLARLDESVDKIGVESVAVDRSQQVVPDVEEIAKIPTVMVVDDSITIRKVTTRMLERNEYSVLTAKDGIDAVAQLQENIPDVMLLDIEMPRMDGYELATHIRNDERLKDIPIIMITSRTGEKHRQRAMEIGVNKYLGKPYQEADLLENITDILAVSDG